MDSRQYSHHCGYTALQMLNLVDIIVGFESPASAWAQGGNQGICPQPNFITTAGDPGYCSGTAKKPQYCTSDLTLCKCVANNPSQFSSKCLFCESPVLVSCLTLLHVDAVAMGILAKHGKKDSESRRQHLCIGLPSMPLILQSLQ